MLIFQRYLFKQFVSTYIGSLILFIGMYVIVKLLEQLSNFIKAADRTTAVEYIMFFVYEMPFMLSVLIPISTLFSIVYVLSRMNSQNELVAYYSSGSSIFKACVPIIIFVFIISSLLLYFDKSFIYDNHQRHIYIHKHIRNSAQQKVVDRHNLTIFGSENKIYFIKKYDPNAETMSNAQILYLNENNIESKTLLSAKSVFYNKEDGVWVGNNVIVRYWEGNEVVTERYDELDLDLQEKPYHFEEKETRVEHLSAEEVLHLAKKYEVIGGDYNVFYTEFFFKTAIPYLSLIILFFGIPLSTFLKKASVVLSLFFVLVVAFTFFIISYMGNSLGKADILPPLIGGWFGNFVFFIASLIMMKKLQL